VLASDLHPLGSVIIASTVSKRRAQGIYAVLESGYDADASIYLHPAESGAGLGDIKTASAGLLKFRIIVSGQPPDTLEPTHTPFYHRAINPIDKAWVVYNALNTLAEHRAQEVHHPAFTEVGRSTNLFVAHIHAGEEGRSGRVASSAVMTGSVTFPPGENILDVQQQIEAAIQQAAASDPWLKEHPPQLQWVMGTNGVEVPLDGPIYTTVHRAIKSATGSTPEPQSLHSGSDIRAPILYSGIPTVGFGPLAGDLTQAGGTDEWVSVEDYLRMIQVVATVIVDWCGTPS
jgi:acetylornithine deacetylase